VAKGEWDAHTDDLAWRRELIGLLIERIIVKPVTHRHLAVHPHFGARFDPESVAVVPRSSKPLGNIASEQCSPRIVAPCQLELVSPPAYRRSPFEVTA